MNIFAINCRNVKIKTMWDRSELRVSALCSSRAVNIDSQWLEAAREKRRTPPSLVRCSMVYKKLDQRKMTKFYFFFSFLKARINPFVYAKRKVNFSPLFLGT